MNEKGLSLVEAAEAAKAGATVEGGDGVRWVWWKNSLRADNLHKVKCHVALYNLYGWHIAKPAPEPEPEFEEWRCVVSSARGNELGGYVASVNPTGGSYLPEQIEHSSRFEDWGFRRPDGTVFRSGRHVQYTDGDGRYWDYPGPGRTRVYADFARMRKRAAEEGGEDG